MKINKTFLLIIITILFSSNVFGQDSYIKSRWNIKAGYARYTKPYLSSFGSNKTSNFRIEGNYGITNLFEAGVYIGVSNQSAYRTDIGNVMTISNDGADTSFSDHTYMIIEYYISPSYGINLNFHILPLFIESSGFRFDLYIAGKYGGTFIPAPKDNPFRGYHHEYGVGLGLGFYPWKRVGFFVEYSVGKYHLTIPETQINQMTDGFKDRTKLRYGITIKF